MSNDDPIDWIARAGARAKGKRPDTLNDYHAERTLSIVMALAGELAVVKERLDTVERLLETKAVICRADIDAYAPDRDAAYDRALMTKEYVARIMRGMQQEMEAMQAAPEPSLAELNMRMRDT
ncbi:hypothetical protein [Sphingopyxis lindanitolerans]|nr:hypothetical protein [Sphingopyxis lindanitolerans]